MKDLPSLDCSAACGDWAMFQFMSGQFDLMCGGRLAARFCDRDLAQAVWNMIIIANGQPPARPALLTHWQSLDQPETLCA